jgi:hypothetical protein
MPQEPFVSLVNGIPLVTRRTLPITWRDSMSPAMSLEASAAAAPGKSTFAGSIPNELVLPTYNPATNDRAFGTIQFDHDAETPSTGASITFAPHVHWTCSTSPTTGTFVEWKLCYSIAKPGVTFATAGKFSTTILTSTGRTTVPVTAADFAHKHMLTPLQTFTVASSLYGASAIAIISVQASSITTLDATPMLLAADVHYQARGGYTVTEYV